jgi:hypothetical protein
MKYLNLLILGLALALLAGVCQAQPQTNTIGAPDPLGRAYFINGGAVGNPTISLTAGVTNVFVVTNDSSIHPVIITTTPPPNSSGQYGGASPQNITSGNINLVTPATGFPTKLYYMCSIHLFGGEIDLSAPIGAAPPRNTILQIKVGTNIVMTSTGTNTTWTLVPQYSTNLASQLWTPVPTYNNSFSNGTNTTVFDRLDPIAGPNVYLRISQQPH